MAQIIRGNGTGLGALMAQVTRGNGTGYTR